MFSLIRIRAVAVKTLRELYRDYISWGLLFTALMFAFISMNSGPLKSENPNTLLVYWTVFYAWIGILFATSGAISLELKAGTLQTIVTKPISRAEFIFGKTVGATVQVLLNVILASFLLLAMMKFYFGMELKMAWSDLLVLYGLTFLETLAWGTLGITLSTFLPGNSNGWVAFFSWIAIPFIGKFYGNDSILVLFLNLIIPNYAGESWLSKVYGSSGLDFHILGKTVFHLSMYVVVATFVASFIFSKRQVGAR
ncbi:MAG: ABC transporter permease subunit [Candidatus Ozemobacteraceae bacterium]